MQAILLGSGQLHTFQRIDESTKMHWSIAWDFVNCSAVPESYQNSILSQCILYAMQQHDTSFSRVLNWKCSEDITLIRQIIVEAATVHSKIPSHYVLPFLQIVREELYTVAHLISIGMKIPVLSILHGTQKKNSEAYGQHRCLQCSGSLCNTTIILKEEPHKKWCHECFFKQQSLLKNKAKKSSSKKGGNGNDSFSFDQINFEVKMQFMSQPHMFRKVLDLQKRFANNDDDDFVDLIRKRVESTLQLFSAVPGEE